MLARIAGLMAVLLAWSTPANTTPPPPLEAYGDLPAIEDMALSPDGIRVAMVSRSGSTRRLSVSEDGRELLSMPLLNMKFRDVAWAGERTVLVISSKTESLPLGLNADKAELFEAMLVPLDGGKPEKVFGRRHSIDDSVHGLYGVRQVDGRWKAYFGGIETARTRDRRTTVFKHGRPALFEVDLGDNQTRKIAPPAERPAIRRWLVGANGQIVATFDVDDRGNWEIRNASSLPIAGGNDPTRGVRLICLGKDGRSAVYKVEDDARQTIRWLSVPLAGGLAQEVLPRGEIEEVYVGGEDGRLMGYMEGGPGKKPVFFDPGRQADIDAAFTAFPGYDLRLKDWSPEFGLILLRRSGKGDSGSWLLFDTAAKTARLVGKERPSIGAEHFGPVSRVEYKASDGLSMDGILTLPPGRKAEKLPAIMLPHGGPSSHDTLTFDWMAQAFASRGYAVFQPNFRGSTNRDEPFRRAGNGQWGRKMQTDLSDGLAALARRGIVDPARACIVGGSYGGFAALAGVTLQNGVYRCAVSIAGVSDLGDMYWTDYRESGKSIAVRHSLIEDLGDPALFDEVSPRLHAARADAPVLLVHGKDDTVVPFRHSAKMADALKDAGTRHELVLLRKEDHWLSRSETRKQMLAETMRFVRMHNPPD